MKLKLKFDQEAMKQFFLDHVEKIVFGVVILAFLGFVLGAVGQKGLSFGPEELEKTAQETKSHLDQPRNVEIAIPEFDKQADKVREEIPASAFQSNNQFITQIVVKKGKRGEPRLLAVQKLRAVPGHGAFAMAPDTDPGEESEPVSPTRGQRWVSVLGLIPNEEQIEEFKRVFENVVQPNAETDTAPRYLHSYVERAEVNPQQEDTDPAKLNWKPINVAESSSRMRSENGRKRAKSCAIPHVSCRHKRFASRPVRCKTGPGGLTSWCAHQSTHLRWRKLRTDRPGKKPDELSNDEGPSKEEQPVAPGPKRIKRRIPKAVNIDDLPDEPLDEEQGSGMGPQQMNRPPMMPGGGMRPPMGMMSGGSRPPMGMMSGGSRPPMGMMSGGMRPPMGMMSGGMRPPMGMPGMGSRMGGGSRPGYGQSGAAEEEEEFKPPQYLLYRFFDFTVKPGKYYRYRVRLRNE